MSDRTLPGVHQKPGGGFPTWAWLVIAGGALLVVVIIVVSSMSMQPTGSSGAVSDGEPADSDPGQYVQTWDQPYSETTCTDWNSVMTEQQQFAAAADILAGAWGKVEKSSRFPSNSLIRQFQAGITESCVVPSYTLTNVTYLLYNSETTFKP